MSDRSAFHGVISLATPGARIMVGESAPPLYDRYTSHAALVDEIDLETDGRYLFVADAPAAGDWPSIVVAMRYEPNTSGFDPGVAATDSCLFIGAGDAAHCYTRGSAPRKLWSESVEIGFLGWAIHDDIVVMSAELTLAAWDANGRKLWSTFVEPPWSYAVEDGHVTLDVMGAISSFDLATGPAAR